MTARPATLTWSLPRALLAALSLLAALMLGALLTLTLTGGAPWAALAGWSAGAALALLALRARYRRHGAALPLGPSRTPAPLALLLGFGAALLIDTLAPAQGLAALVARTPELAALAGQAPMPAAWLPALLYLLLLQPLAEGLVFRGLLQPALQARGSPYAALLLTALAWTLFHLLAYAASPAALAPGPLVAGRLAVGLLLGTLRRRNATARAAVVAHAGLNLFALLRLLSLGL